MKFSILAVAASVALVGAQDLGNVPACAVSLSLCSRISSCLVPPPFSSHESSVARLDDHSFTIRFEKMSKN